MSPLQIAFAQTFMRSMDRLTAKESAAVMEAVRKYQKGHGSTHLHQLASVPYKGLAVSQGALRIVCRQDGGTLLLLHADHHDAAYAWAERHRVVRVGDTVRILPTEIATASTEDATPSVRGPLTDVPDKTFRHFEVGPLAAAVFRTVPTEDALLDVAASLKPALGEALISLGADPDRLDEIVLAYQSAPAGSQRPLSEVIAAPQNSDVFYVAPGERELELALSGDFAAWRLFLHPSQRRIVERDTRGAAMVKGGPGTGKTVVALHRARHLASKVFADDGRPVLVTTFSRVLGQQVAADFSALCGGEVLPVEVASLHAVAVAVLDRGSLPRTLVTGEVLDACWEDALAFDVAGRGRRFYEEEREQVLAEQGVWTEAAYLRVARKGRKGRLDRAAKLDVWRVLAAFEAALSARGGGDTIKLVRDAREAVESGRVPSPYAAVVCDEVQDVGPVELRFLAALAREGDAVGPNRLFLVGDDNQRIYRRRTSFAKCGIDIVGRSSRLRLNYRTTEGIRSAALAALAGADVDLASGERSLRGGPPPSSRRLGATEEIDFIAEQALDDALVLVVARTNGRLDKVSKALADRGTAHVRLGREDVAPAVGLVLCTIHRSKGLEAEGVVVLDAEKVQDPRLSYVAMTRARDWCVLVDRA